MGKKYKLTEERKTLYGVTLYRIKAVRDFGDVVSGEEGGFVESERNLSQDGDAWIFGDAKVYGNAEVFGDAKVFSNAEVCGDAKVFGKAEVFGDAEVYGDAKVCGNARVCGDAKVCGDAEVYGDAKVCGNAWVCGDAKVCGDADYIVFKNWWSSGRYFTWMRSNNKWRVGCFYGMGEELIKKAYKDSELSGREYGRVVKYIEDILSDYGQRTTDNGPAYELGGELKVEN